MYQLLDACWILNIYSVTAANCIFFLPVQIILAWTTYLAILELCKSDMNKLEAVIRGESADSSVLSTPAEIDLKEHQISLNNTELKLPTSVLKRRAENLSNPSPSPLINNSQKTVGLPEISLANFDEESSDWEVSVLHLFLLLFTGYSFMME